MQSDPTPSSGECLLLESPQRELRESARPLVTRSTFFSAHALGFLGCLTKACTAVHSVVAGANRGPAVVYLR